MLWALAPAASAQQRAREATVTAGPDAEARAKNRVENRAGASTVVLTLAADPGLEGPPAWVWLRDAPLRERCEPLGLDPTAPLTLSWSREGLAITAAAEAPEAGCYLSGWARIGSCRVWLAGDADGTEDWLVECPAETPVPGLVAALGLHPGVARSYDVMALVAAIAPPGAFDDPDTLLLAAAGAACAETDVTCERTSVDVTPGLRLRGTGGGGLTVPAALLALASGGLDRALDPTPKTPAERWVWMAAAARGAYREEALRQLTLVDGDAADEALRRALLADEWIRVVAMRALADRVALGASSPSVLDALAHAADGDQPGALETARLALARLWPTLDTAARRALRDEPAAAGLWAARDATAAPHRPRRATSPSPSAPSRSLAPWRSWAWLWILASTAACAVAWRRLARTC